MPGAGSSHSPTAEPSDAALLQGPASESDSESEFSLSVARRPRDQILTQTDVLEEWVPRLTRGQGQLYRKIQKVHAKIADTDGVLEGAQGTEEEPMPFSTGDYIAVGSRSAKYVIKMNDFNARYHRFQPEPASDPKLSGEGFFMYRPKGMVWAYQPSAEEIDAAFPARRFVAKWGSDVEFRPYDYLAIPYPEEDEVYLIPRAVLRVTYQLVSDDEKRRSSSPTKMLRQRLRSTKTPKTGETDESSAPPSGRTKGLGTVRMSPAELMQVSAFDKGDRTTQEIDSTPTEAAPPYLLHPHCVIRLSWDVFTVVLIFYSIIVIPLVLAFDPPSARPGRQGAMSLINRFIDFIFMVDVMLNFITAVEEDRDDTKVLITSLPGIGRRYLRGWFCVDILSAFPIDMVVNEQTGKKVKVVQMIKSLKVFRLLRVVRRVRRLSRAARIVSCCSHRRSYHTNHPLSHATAPPHKPAQNIPHFENLPYFGSDQARIRH